MSDSRENREYTPEESSAYSDAYYRQAPETRRSCYGYSPAQCYAHVSDKTVPPPEKQRRSLAILCTMCLVCVLMATILGFGSMFFVFRASAAGTDEPAAEHELYDAYATAENPGEGGILHLVLHSSEGQEPLSPEEIYQNACCSTVGVTVPGYAYNIFGQSGASAVTGTGIVLSEDGYILTNFHVIKAAYESSAAIEVITYDETVYEAEVIGVETDSDIAIVKIDAQGLIPAVFSDLSDMRVGQTIYAVGNPLGELTYTMTSGIVSALDRSVTTDVNVTVNMFQIDAAVNNGNSGGPVYNVYGQVIGVVTAKYSEYGMEGLGFAIPINDACSIASDLVENGYVPGKAYLGLTLTNVSASVARYYGMVQGVYVYDVEEGSCSQKAGIRVGDIITAIDGSPVINRSEMVRAVKQYRAGDTAKLTVYRDADYITVSVEFDSVLPAKTMTMEEAALRSSAELAG